MYFSKSNNIRDILENIKLNAENTTCKLDVHKFVESSIHFMNS